MSGKARASSAETRRRARVLIGGFAAVVVALGLFAAAAPWLFSAQAMRAEIVSQIRRLSGLSARADGEAVFVALPRPHISVGGVGLAGRDGKFALEAEALKGYLRLDALLFGRLEVASATLLRPKIFVDLSGETAPTAGGAIGDGLTAAPATPQAAAADAARLGVLSIVDGRATLKTRSGRMAQFEAIDATLDWRRFGGPASLNGAARLLAEGKPALYGSLSATLDRPAALFRGGASSLSFNLDGPSLTLYAEGEATGAPKPQFFGHVRARAPSLRKLAEIGGYRLALPNPLADFSFEADVGLGQPSASFSNLRLAVDGNDYEGALAIQNGAERPSITGTLASSRISLRPFFARLSPLIARDGQWSRDPFDLDEQDFADLDLRISAARLFLPGAELTDAAVSLMKRGRRLDVGLIEAQAGEGSVKGRVSFVKTGEGLEAKLSAAASGVDASFFQFGTPEGWRVFGATTLAASAQSAGRSMYEMMRNLEGSAEAAAGRGEIVGLNLVAALRSIDARPLALAQDIRYGSTSFASAGFGLKATRGVATIVDGTLDARLLKLAFGGSIDLAERMVEAHASARATEAAAGKAPRQFSFEIVGGFGDLALVPDALSLIRQSDAAAPLFGRGPTLGGATAAAPAN